MSHALAPRPKLLRRLLTLAVLIASLVGKASGDEIPSALRGKTIVAHWSDTRTTKDVDAGTILHFHMDYTITAYISEKGRIFTSYLQSVNGTRVTKDEVSDSDQKVIHWQYDNKSLIADIPLTRGVRRVTIPLVNNFKNCSLSVLNAHPAGTDHMIVKSLTSGTERELLEVKIVSSDCTIKAGNLSANAAVKITIHFTEVEQEFSTGKTYRAGKSRVIVLTSDRQVRVSQTDAGFTQSAARPLGLPDFGKNAAGVDYVVRNRIDNGAILIGSFLKTFSIETRITTNGTDSCEAHREYKLHQGQKVFVDRNIVTREDMYLSDIHAENMVCSIESAPE